MSKSNAYRIESDTPCCGVRVHLIASEDEPSATFERTCKACKTLWRIEQKSQVFTSGPLNGLRGDVMDWNRVISHV